MKFGENSVKLREIDIYNTKLYTPESYSLSMKGIKLEDVLNYEFSLVSLMERWDASLENQIEEHMNGEDVLQTSNWSRCWRH